MSSQLQLASDIASLEELFADLATNSSAPSATDWLLIEAEIILTVYVPPVLTVLGLLGNGIVLLPVACLVTSSSACALHVYAAIIVLLHSLVLMVSHGLRWADMYFGSSNWLREMRVTSETHCLMSHYVETLIIGLDHWFVFVLAAECYVIARHPERVFRFRLERVIDVIVIVLATMGAFGLHHFWTFTLEIDVLYGGWTCRMRVRNLTGDMGGEVYGMVLRQLSPMAGDILPSIGVVVVYAMTVHMHFRRRQRMSHPTCQCLARRCQGDNNKVKDESVTTSAEERWVVACRKRAAYFVVDSESFESMADRVGPMLSLTFILLAVPKLLIVQPLDKIAFQHVDGTRGIIWSLIVDVANTLEAVSLGSLALILLPNCRLYRFKLFQLLRYLH